MNRLPSRPARALVHQGPDQPIVRAQAPFRVEKEPGWSGIREVLAVFGRHLWLIAIITTVAVAIAAWQVTKKVPQYYASTVIRLVDRQPGIAGVQIAETNLNSELVVLKGRRVLGQAVDREGLRLFSTSTGSPTGLAEEVVISLPPEESGTITLDFGENGITYGQADGRRTAEYGEPILIQGAKFVIPSRPTEGSVVLRVVPRDAAIDFLAGSITTAPNSGNRSIEVTITTTEPRIAPRAVNAVVEEYQTVHAELARQNVSRKRAFLEEQLRTTDSLLMVAQTELSNLRTSTQSYSAAGRFSAEQGNLMQVELEEAQLQADLRMSENLLNRITQARSAGQSVDFSELMSLPVTRSAPVISQLYSQLIGFRAEREGMLVGEWARAPTHPDVQRLDTLLALTEERLVNAVRGHIGSLQAQIAALGGLRGRALGRMSDLPRTEVQEEYLTQNLGALQFISTNLRDEYQEVRLEEAAETGLVEIVHLSTRALSMGSNDWVVLLLGLVVGLMVGGGVAMAREMFDDSIGSPQEIENILLVPNLAVIPEASSYLLESPSNGGGSPGAFQSPGTEAYRILRTNLLFSQKNLKTLVVTSAAPGEGKTMTSVNLAAAYARQGWKVLLMECDLRRPSLDQYFENSPESNLTDVLFEGRDWREVVQRTKVPGLFVLLAGQSRPRATEFLGGDEMKRLLANICTEFDTVILDTSPLLVAADATVLGAIVDGVLLVVRASRTDRGAVEQAVHQLSLVGANIVGTVLNDPEGATSRYGNYYDYSAEYKIP